ncbi:type II secretion system protein [Catenovulum sp. SM1970]|uniref:pilus assembly FimT family protein n=1 Tax=Marinifaba aquimaris TaxID=2741323 RepID=UPI00157397D9|nr:type II secretion system protein [Marinifaba aquimaris]NTS76915.1 type II secretion system protein [Marinifaba aquimaris]
MALKRQDKGFTLVELLIVSSILSMLLLVGSYSYSLFAQRWNKELGSFNQNNQLMINLARFQTLLNNQQYNVVFRDDAEPGFFFVGNSNSILSITNQGLFNQKFAEAFRLTLVKNNRQKLDLVYQSAPLDKLALSKASTELVFQYEFKLLTDLDDASFEYYGFESFEQKSISNRPNVFLKPKWFSQYSGLDSQLFPEKIKFSFIHSGRKIEYYFSMITNSEELLSDYFPEEPEQ